MIGHPGPRRTGRTSRKPSYARGSSLYRVGRKQAERDCAAALEPLREAQAIDDQYAELHYQTASCLKSLGRAR